MENDYSSYPKKGDQLFKEIVGDWDNVCLDPFSGNWPKYIGGYKDSADILAEHLINNQYGTDYLIYPIIFLYRHYLELQMKMIIKDGYQLLDASKIYHKIHNLNDLWRDCRIIVEKMWPDCDQKELNAIEECIFEFSAIDPKSQLFRYPEGRNGDILIDDIRYVNLTNLKDVMKRIENSLDPICDAISIALSEKKDIEAEYTSNEF